MTNKVATYDVYLASSQRIESSWRNSIVLNALIIGWVMATYLAFDVSFEPSLQLQLVFSLFHFPAYIVSCRNVVAEYNFLFDLLDALKEEEFQNPAVLTALRERIFFQSKWTSALFVLFIHLIYGGVIYITIWHPSFLLPM